MKRFAHRPKRGGMATPRLFMTTVKTVHIGAVMKFSNLTPGYLALSTLLALATSHVGAQSFDASSTTRHHALASAPRSLEGYPWLAARGVTRHEATRSTAATSLASARSHGALSQHPRVLEQFPELTRDTASRRNPATATQSPALPRNEALAASPRTVEQFPALSRTPSTPAFEIAPLK